MFQKEDQLYNVSRIALLLALGIPCLLIFYPFFMPILIATFVAFGCEPMMRKVQRHRRRRGFFSAILFLVLIILFVMPVILVVLRLIESLKDISAQSMQDSQFFQAILQLWQRAQETITSIANSVGMHQNILPKKEEIFAKVSPFVVDKTTLLLGSIPDLGLSLFVFFCVLFVIILNAKSIKEAVVNSKILPPDELQEVISAFQSSSYVILISTILIGMLQALIVAVGSLIFGFHEFLLIFAITFFVSFIPVIGAAPVAFLLAVISFLLGNSGSGIGLIVVTIVAGSIDNIIKPFVFSKDEEGLHPVVSLLGLIGAIVVFGLPGLLLGPLLLQVTIKLAPTFVRRLFTPAPQVLVVPGENPRQSDV
jgi:predicted PurR-regulated permease PerM